MPRYLQLMLLIAAVICADPVVIQAEELHYNLVDFSVQARREVGNDLMRATLFAEAVGSDPAELAAAVNRQLTAAAAQAKAVEAVKVESGRYQSSPNYQKGKQDGWRTRAELRLESGDFAALAKLIGRLQSAGLQLSDMQFLVSLALRARIEAELTKEALEAFKSRADLVRQSLNAQTVKIVSIRLEAQNSQQPRPLYRAKAMAAMDEAAPPAAEAGSSDIVVSASGSVQVQ